MSGFAEKNLIFVNEKDQDNSGLERAKNLFREAQKEFQSSPETFREKIRVLKAKRRIAADRLSEQVKTIREKLLGVSEE